MNKPRVRILYLASMFFLAFVSALTLIFAWYAFVFDAGVFWLDTGRLSPSLGVRVWKNEAWMPIGGNHYDLFFGEMRNLAELPEINTFYFCAEVSETEVAAEYFFYLQTINISAGEVDDEGNFLIFDNVEIDYYEYNCFEYTCLGGTEQNNVAELEFLEPPVVLQATEQMLIHSLTPLVYLRLQLRLEGIQGICQNVSPDRSPYLLVFELNFFAEVRTIG